MEQRLTDLLSDAFSDTSIPSFPDGDFEFENFNFEEKFDEENTGVFSASLPTKEVAHHQEESDDIQNVSRRDSTDAHRDESVDIEQTDIENGEDCFQTVEVARVSDTISDEECAEEGSVRGEEEEDEDEDKETGELCDGDKEDTIFAEGQPLAPESAEKPQVRNEEQGETDEEVSYFESVLDCGDDTKIKGDGIEEDELTGEETKLEDLSNSESEDMKIENGENCLSLCFELEAEHSETAKATVEFSEISEENLQYLIAEVDTEEKVEVRDFSGEEHQEAGESFADYPSDFSSCEYVQNEGRNHKSCHQLKTLACVPDHCSSEKLVTDTTQMGTDEGSDEADEGSLSSGDLETDAQMFLSQSLATETAERVLSNAAVYWTNDRGETDVRSYEEYLEQTGPKQPPEVTWDSAASSRWSVTDVHPPNDDNRRPLCEEPQRTNKEESWSSDVTQYSAADVHGFPEGQSCEETTSSPSNQGSVDDSFFFNAEVDESELGQLGDDEYEEERGWEQEKERIKAFYRFYDDGDRDNEKEGRKIKVQFCTNPLSQVIHYETDSSDRESLNSSTEGEDDLSPGDISEEIKEPGDTSQTEPACYLPTIQLPEQTDNLNNADICRQPNKGLGVLKLILKMGLGILLGLLVFWMALDQGDWLCSFFF